MFQSRFGERVRGAFEGRTLLKMCRQATNHLFGLLINACHFGTPACGLYSLLTPFERWKRNICRARLASQYDETTKILSDRDAGFRAAVGVHHFFGTVGPGAIVKTTLPPLRRLKTLRESCRTLRPVQRLVLTAAVVF